jgi:SNF2 family DNA or RNA helicase
MKVLHRLLVKIKEQDGRILLFSESTQALDLIEEYIKLHYSYLRMDGNTPKELRTSRAREFTKDSSKFVFLLSKKAFGTGLTLTLTAANYVILFDTSWNPATDSQAQDRAFRIVRFDRQATECETVAHSFPPFPSPGSNQRRGRISASHTRNDRGTSLPQTGV